MSYDMKYFLPFALLIGLGFPSAIAEQSYTAPLTIVIEAESVPQETPVDRVGILVDVIKKFEGFYAGSRAQVNNNPCNLRWSSRQTSKVAGFAYFATYQQGREACRHQITIAADGRSKVYRPDMTLLKFFNVYAPTSDNNQPSAYYAYVIKHTGFDKDMPLSSLLE